MECVFISRQDVNGAHFKPAREGFHKMERVGCIKSIVAVFLRNQAGILPNGNAVSAPVATHCPPRKRFTRVPLALSEMKQSTRRYLVAKSPDQPHSSTALQGSHGVAVPLRTVRFVDTDERRLATHSQPNILSGKIRVDLMGDLLDSRPLLIIKGLCAMTSFIHAADGHR